MRERPISLATSVSVCVAMTMPVTVTAVRAIMCALTKQDRLDGFFGDIYGGEEEKEGLGECEKGDEAGGTNRQCSSSGKRHWSTDSGVT